jgi:hypothetical protein
MAREHFSKLRNSAAADVHAIQLTGCSGTSAVYVNGEYAATEDECGGHPIYRKKDDSDILIEYWAPLEEWQVTCVGSRATLDSRLDVAAGQSHRQSREERSSCLD